MRLGGLCSWFSRVGQELDAAVVGVGDVDVVVGADGDAGGQTEFARRGAGLAEAQQEASVRIKDLDVVEYCVRDINVAEGIGGDAFGPAEVAGGVAGAADLRKKLALRIEDLDAAVKGICHEDPALGAGGDVGREIEFSRAC